MDLFQPIAPASGDHLSAITYRSRLLTMLWEEPGLTQTCQEAGNCYTESCYETGCGGPPPE
jgi:hypothetical protein